MANNPAWHHRAGARPSAPSGGTSIGGLLDAVLNNSSGPAGLLNDVIRATEGQQAGRAAPRGAPLPQGARLGRDMARAMSRLSRLHPGRMLADELISRGLSYALDRLRERGEPDADKYAPIGGWQFGPGWRDRTTEWADAYSAQYTPFHSAWYVNAGGIAIDVVSQASQYRGDPASDAAGKLTATYMAASTIRPALPLFPNTHAMSMVIGWSRAMAGPDWAQHVLNTPHQAMIPYDPEADEVEIKLAIARALSGLSGIRDPSHPDDKPWPNSREAGDVHPSQVQPGLWLPPRLLPWMEAVADLGRQPQAGPNGPPRIVDGPTTVPVRPRGPQPVVQVRPMPLRERGRVVRERNLAGRSKLRMRWPVAAWAMRTLAENVLERCDQVKALWNSLDPSTRKIIRQRWFERRWNAGDRRPPKQPPCNEMAVLLYEYRRYLRPEPVVRELLWEHIEDFLYGKMGQVTGEALGNIMGRQGPHTTINPGGVERADRNHWASPEIPLDQLQELITGRDGRTSSDADRQLAIDEGIRRRREWRAEMSRRQAYRRGD